MGPNGIKFSNLSQISQFQSNFTIQEISLLADAGTLWKSGIPAAGSLVALVLIAPVSTCLFLTIENIKTLLS